MELERVVVWGVGNAILGDDGAGLVLARELERLDPPGMVVRVCEGAPANYLGTLVRDEPSLLVIVDASDMGLEGGEVRRIGMERLEEVSFTSHDMPFGMLLEGCAPGLEAFVIAVQPGSLELGEGLSAAVRAAVEGLAVVIAERRWDEILFLD